MENLVRISAAVTHGNPVNPEVTTNRVLQPPLAGGHIPVPPGQRRPSGGDPASNAVVRDPPIGGPTSGAILRSSRVRLAHVMVSQTEHFQSQDARLLVNGSLGQTASLSPEIPHGKLDIEVVWRRSSPKLQIARYIKKHVDYYGSEDYKKRIKLHPGNFSLQISDLQREDAGGYEVLFVTTDSGEETRESFQLDVYEPVTGTEISREITDNCTVTLTCSVNTGDHISFRWWRGQTALINNSSHHLSTNGQELQFHVTEDTNGTVYMCEARNPVSEGTAQFNVGADCSARRNESGTSQNKPLLYILLVLALVVALSSILIIWRITDAKKKRRLTLGVSNEPGNGQNCICESQTVYAFVQPVKKHQERRPPPEGNEMVPKETETPFTVYDTVKNPGAPVSELPDQQCD
ncbi:SLAM family member 5-like [Scyliorhinus torazame]|uniref:SLAM family member 5-like n=1 Tax=Scyliorhinus torazame TaxID=75743 RepID=UPI003B59F9A8